MKKQLKWVIYVVCFLSVIASISVGYDRHKVESSHKQYDIAVKYTDVLNISRQNKLSYKQVLQELKDIGVNVLLVTENKIFCDEPENLASFEAQGKATWYYGYDLINSNDESDIIKPEYTYIWCLDEYTKNNIYGYLNNKGYVVNEINYDNKVYLEVPYRKNVLTTIGVGFNEADMQKAAEYGYTICPQVASLSVKGDQGVSYMLERIEALPNLGPIFFNDSDVTCYITDEIINLAKEHGIGFVEFFSNKQTGFSKLVESTSSQFTDFNMYRLHTLADGELDKYEGANLFDRFELALTERSISYFLFKLPKKYMPSENYDTLKETISEFRAIAAHEGYSQGGLTPVNFKAQNYIKTLLVGLAAIGVFILLCIEVNEEKLGYLLGALGVLGYAVLLKLNMRISVQLMALFITISFPIYAMNLVYKCKSGSLIEVIKGIVIVFITVMVGAISFVGTMSRTEFALGIELFRGVKVSFLVPVVIVGIMYLYKEELLKIKLLEKWIMMPITYLVVAIMGVFLVIFAIYIIRSGNSGGVSEAQIQLRQMLKDIFGTRPRTKEFLIGYPIIMCLIYFGKHKLYIPLSVLATVGPVSVINTFTHTHTPLMISIKRSLWGVVVGFVIGLILIGIVKVCINIFKVGYKKYQTTNGEI